VTISDSVLTKLPAQSYATISKKVRDGDILLCAAHDPFSRIIGWSTKSPWSHVALAWRWPAVGRHIVLECVQQLGVRAVPLDRFIRETSSGQKPYPGKIILARHRILGEGSAQEQAARASDLAKFAIDRIGDRFSSAEVLKIALRIVVGRLDIHMPKSLGPNDEFICSEFVAKCFERINIQIQWDGLGFIAPADFADDPNVGAVARFRTT
jgi:hypothetical protein